MTFLYVFYGSLSTSMVMSLYGVGIKESLGTVETFGFRTLSILFAVLMLISAFARKTEKAHYSRRDISLLCFSFIIIISKPIHDGMQSWGTKFFIKNVEYTPTFISQPYLDQYKTVIGPFISSISIFIQSEVDKKI